MEKRVAWNKGRIIGQKAPLKQQEIWAIRTRLEIAKNTRELALLNLAIDSKLRGCDQIDQEAMLAGRENGLQILLELSPQKESYIREELRKLRYERLALQSCRQVLSEFGFSN
ncbi:hypothetical protein [Rheinheimera sp.]|uniref:hypothetical protein n=1 Tax=Rheinheimera sp. TaxID=1869214 RepID=UPI0040488B7D